MSNRLSSLSFWFAISCLAITRTATAKSLCACQPGIYKFTLDFSLTCNARLTGPGINDYACIVHALDQSVVDLVPVVVYNIQILELDQNLDVLVQTELDGNFRNKDSFTFTSTIASAVEERDSLTIPSALQVSLQGENTLSAKVVNSWTVVYDNKCNSYPVVSEGQKAGWAVFSELGDPSASACNLASSASSSSISKTSKLSFAPSTNSKQNNLPSRGPSTSPTPVISLKLKGRSSQMSMSMLMAMSPSSLNTLPSGAPSMNSKPRNYPLNSSTSSGRPSYSPSLAPISRTPSISPIPTSPATATSGAVASLPSDRSQPPTISATAADANPSPSCPPFPRISRRRRVQKRGTQVRHLGRNRDLRVGGSRGDSTVSPTEEC